MTFKELEALMVKHGAVIRAITENERIIVQKRHADQFPNVIQVYQHWNLRFLH